ncbi:MAG: hypothetical protein CVT88_00645 [Candidatus Altiarchaeales archaeon HGW-Altiarchaeales-1]|nr:MAG: hypothetical protein CVT88_00645 [Candidatus Altiarchaeales archaeon HGW-Altiarchaeales-1]
MDKTNIEDFYVKWQANLPQRIDGYIYDENKRILPTRFIFAKFKKIFEKFLNNELLETEKIILMPGIRGIGKSTLLSQIYKFEKFLKPKDERILENIGKLDERVFIDVSQLRFEKVSLKDFFNFYEEVKGFHFENPQKKILILLDEVHFDEDWGLFLKTIFDRTRGHRDILIIATGSSALQINMIPDIGRRTDVQEIYPMKFSEYLILKYNKFPTSGLSGYLQDALFNSSNATDVFKKLEIKSKEIRRFFVESVPFQSEKDFFESGSFPSTIKIENKQKAMEKIKTIIDGVIIKDVVTLQNFKTHTIAKISELLYLLAKSDVISYDKLNKTLGIGRNETLESLIDVLVMSGIIVKMKAYGVAYGSTRKTPKLLFITPSLRGAILNNYYLPGIEGKKLEDYFALIYMEDLKDKFASDISYDSAEGGADFVLTMNDRSKIVIEVGFNKEDIGQVINTQKKVNGKYSIIFGSEKLELVNDSIVKVPLRYLLLL